MQPRLLVLSQCNSYASDATPYSQLYGFVLTSVLEGVSENQIEINYIVQYSVYSFIRAIV